MGQIVSDPLDERDDVTPLTPEEREGLIPSHITSRGQLNELEEQNIAEAIALVFVRRRNPLTESFSRNLHRRMFGKVWKWAGKYRTSNKNIGPNYWEVQPELVRVFETVRSWIEHEIYPPDEIAIRFHRDIVWVHPFPNGNGRWSRFMADMLCVYLRRDKFTWGGSPLRGDDKTRELYIDALHAGDNHDYPALLGFARS